VLECEGRSGSQRYDAEVQDLQFWYSRSAPAFSSIRMTARLPIKNALFSGLLKMLLVCRQLLRLLGSRFETSKVKIRVCTVLQEQLHDFGIAVTYSVLGVFG
jgi:hypothetical protein